MCFQPNNAEHVWNLQIKGQTWFSSKWKSLLVLTVFNMCVFYLNHLNRHVMKWESGMWQECAPRTLRNQGDTWEPLTDTQTASVLTCVIHAATSVKMLEMIFFSFLYCHEVWPSSMLPSFFFFQKKVLQKCKRQRITYNTTRVCCVHAYATFLLHLSCTVPDICGLCEENAQEAWEEQLRPPHFLLLTFHSAALQYHTFHSVRTSLFWSDCEASAHTINTFISC